jgi:hypothetical protein
MLDNPLPDPDDLDFDADEAAADVPAENWPSDFEEAPPDDRELTDFPDPFDDDEDAWRNRIIGPAWCDWEAAP